MIRRLSFVALLACFALSADALVAPAEATAAGNCSRVTVNYSAFDANAVTDTVTLYVTKGFESIDTVIMRRDTDFASADNDAGVLSYTIAVGKSGATGKYMPATDVFTGVSNGNTNSIVASSRGVEAPGTAIIATAVSSGDVARATVGKVTFWICTTTLSSGG